MEHLKQIRNLTDDERLEAQERARRVVVRSMGERPHRNQYDETQVSRFPGWFSRLIGAAMVAMFIAAALPSLFRLYSAGYEYFLHGLDNHFQARIVGVSTFLLAESLIILSTIASRVYFSGRARLIFLVPIVLGLSLALVGNYVVARPQDVFGWLETLSPPIAVLFLALIGEQLVLDAIEQRHANEVAYQQALQAWQDSTAQPEESPRWQAAYANALRDCIREANSRSAGAKARIELMATFTKNDWRALVQRELNASEWFVLQDDAAPGEGARGMDNPFGSIAPGAGAHASGPIMQSVNGHIEGAIKITG